jgi:adhesin/invasin
VASPARSVISANPSSIPADGTSTASVTVHLRDAFDNVVTVGGADVRITTDAGSISDTSDRGDGTYAATLTSGTRVGTALLAFTVAGDPATSTAVVSFVPGPADPGTSTITATPDSVVADGTSTATVTVRLLDAQGNPLASGGALVRISTTLGALGPITDNGDATYTATLRSATTPGTATLAFTVNGDDGAGTDTVRFTVGRADPGASRIAADPAAGVEADGQESSLITVTLRDAQGNQRASGGEDVRMTSTRGTLSGLADQGDGTYTSRLTSTTPGTAVVRFAVNGQDGTGSTSVAFVDTTAPAPPVITAPADGSSVRPDVPIAGTGEAGAIVVVTDASSDPVCSASVNEAGRWTCFPRSPLPIGQVTFTATQTDPSENVSEASAPVTVTVDDTKPTPPTLDPTDGRTITGTAEPGSTITIRNSGGKVVCTTTTRRDGTFSCAPAKPLPAGLLLSCTATDEAGNVSDASRVRVGGPSLTLEFDVVEQGAQRQVATGRGFLPDDAVSGTLASTPVDLGTRTADANGVVAFTIDLPADLSVGEHTVTLTGEASGAVDAHFRVVSTEQPTDPNPPPRAEEPPASGPDQPTLPNTGSPLTVWFVVAGLGLILAGAVLLVGSRTRRTSPPR